MTIKTVVYLALVLFLIVVMLTAVWSLKSVF